MAGFFPYRFRHFSILLKTAFTKPADFASFPFLIELCFLEYPLPHLRFLFSRRLLRKSRREERIIKPCIPHNIPPLPIGSKMKYATSLPPFPEETGGKPGVSHSPPLDNTDNGFQFFLGWGVLLGGSYGGGFFSSLPPSALEGNGVPLVPPFFCPLRVVKKDKLLSPLLHGGPFLPPHKKFLFWTPPPSFFPITWYRPFPTFPFLV